jgi:hypothetical protein
MANAYRRALALLVAILMVVTPLLSHMPGVGGRVTRNFDNGNREMDLDFPTGTESYTVNVTIPRTGDRVSSYVRIRANVSLYQNGRYVGSTTVSGNVYVSGFISGTYLRLSGRGTVSGDVFVSNAAPSQSKGR